MSEKTKEITLINLKLSLFEFYNKNEEGKGSGYPGRIIQSFCDQEKRSTAIAFARWKDLNYAWLSHQDDRPYYLRSEGHLPFDETTFYSLSALYDLYINSL